MPEKSAGVKSKIFKTSVITDEIDQDFETACDLAVEFGLDAVEIRSVYERGPFELTDDDIKCIRKILERKKLKVSAISSPFFKCKISDPDEINSQLEGLKRCIEICDQLDTSLIRGFTFWAQPGITATDIASHFGEAVSILEKTGKILVLESDPSVNATNGKKLAAVIEAVNSPYVQGLWDPGNDIWDPDNEIPYPDGYNFIKKYISHV
ncbi:MAG: sugar phosphate isomerase/epimerase, partial [Treponema sp.]|nr:sugar phosphate isomerase/epimerase [Treponema sp.]